MDLLTTFAQASQYDDYYYSPSTTSADETALAALALVIGLFVVTVFFAIAYVFISLCLMRIFKKAGVPQWIAWVPVYNNWKQLEIGGQQGLWAILMIIPFVNIVGAVFLIIAQYHISKKLGKGGEFVLWAIFLPVVWYPWLAFDKSTWNDKASPMAPSLHGL